MEAIIYSIYKCLLRKCLARVMQIHSIFKRTTCNMNSLLKEKGNWKISDFAFGKPQASLDTVPFVPQKVSTVSCSFLATMRTIGKA